ncbi:LytR family transcriptional regulator [Streptomyces sp. AJS327]|uniref:LCP family protein n=1 Tax=Streptomyces sp. AJS327 TaxID=2545265 RepID=UPI0015DF311C|nr:LCP family protein [Streptomyces sp. AJS327]MBA0049859.1 LytR family transcriptional regulator [Streptomyces sp. AJS327]
MNDRYGHGPYDPSDPYGQHDPYGRGGQPEILGYDEYGQPVYRQGPGPGAPYEPAYDPAYDPTYDPTAAYPAQPGQQGPPGHPGYTGNPGYPEPPGYPDQRSAHDPHGGYAYPAAPAEGYPGDYGQPGGYGGGYGAPAASSDPGAYDPYAVPGPSHEAEAAGNPGYARTREREWLPQQPGPPAAERPGAEPAGGEDPEGAGRVPSQRAPDGAGYQTEQFSFVEEPTDDSEDVIDWLKFTESRTERREEAKRKGRHRVTALVVLVVLVVAGGAGYLWQAGKLPGMDGGGGDAATARGQQRDVIVVHLRDTDGGGSSTALLVANEDAGAGTTLLLPNALAVSAEEGTTTTLGKSVEDEGAAATRDGLSTLLGADIKGTWRLDTPFLETLVELVGGISLDTDVAVPAEKRGKPPRVKQGKDQNLDGRAAVAYATHRVPGEHHGKQLHRFGRVMQATLRKLSSDADGATELVKALGQIPDPSLTERQLGASLAKLAQLAKDGEHATRLVPVRQNGTLSSATSGGLVKDVLGGTVKNSDPDAVLRVSLTNASGTRGAGDTASADLVNSGYTVVDGGAGGAARARSRVSYADAEHKAKATEVAKTLGLPGSAVRQGKGAANADVTVVLGGDYRS